MSTPAPKSQLYIVPDRMGKIVFYNTTTKLAGVRVQMTPTGDFKIMTRSVDPTTPWLAGQGTLHNDTVAALHKHLQRYELIGYFYITVDNISEVDRRYRSSSKK